MAPLIEICKLNVVNPAFQLGTLLTRLALASDGHTRPLSDQPELPFPAPQPPTWRSSSRHPKGLGATLTVIRVPRVSAGRCRTSCANWFSFSQKTSLIASLSKLRNVNHTASCSQETYGS